MIDEKFSAEAFAARGLNTKQSLELANDLADEIQIELHTIIAEHLEIIVSRLIEMGHQLKLYEVPRPGDISYHDAADSERGYQCKLRIGVDTVISTGYSHFDTDQPSKDSEIDWINPESWPNKDK
jgi:hypothetical protein